MTIRPARRGFSLMELMTVIAIIVVLAALSTGTFFRINANEKVRATNATLVKLNTSLNRKWKAILDQAAEDSTKGNIPPSVMNFAGGDRDRARVIWTYYKLKNELPTSFAEARGDVCPNPTQLSGGDTRRGLWIWSPQTNATPAIYIDQLKPRTIFAQLPLTGGTPQEQSAACLYIALMSSASRGEVTEGDGLTNQSGTLMLGPGADNLKVFSDAWDMPIAFSRMNFGSEINTPDYVRGGTAVRDPNDPTGILAKATPGWTIAPVANCSLNDFWPRITTNHIAYPGFPTTVYPLPSQNWVMSVFSAGPNKNWDGGFYAADSDNLVGFRANREGNRSD